MKKEDKEGERSGTKGLLKGAATIAAGGFLAKVIGALYRIPLTNIIGGRGLGLYQMAYPLYCLLLTLSATGIPSAIAAASAARLGRGESDEGVLKAALRLFLTVGGIGSLLMCALAPILSRAQGEPLLLKGYLALAPAVFLTSAISVFRGWFQGRNKMSPTAQSEVVEQLVKVGLGLLFAKLFEGRIYTAVAGLLLAVTLSEAVTLLFLILRFRRVPAPFLSLREAPPTKVKSLLSLTLPLAFSGGLTPLSGLVDSVWVVRILSRYSQDAVALYGLFSGGAVTVVNLPVSVCYGIAAASVPAVAAIADPKRRRRKILSALGLTVGLGGLGAAALYLFAPTAVGILFRSLATEEKRIMIRLIRTFSVSALTLSGVQTLAACLTAQGKPKYAALSVGVGVTVKTLLSVLLVSNPKIGVFGLPIAANICYLLAFALNFVYNLYMTKSGDTPRERTKKSKEKANNDHSGWIGRACGRFNGKRQTGDRGGGAGG